MLFLVRKKIKAMICPLCKKKTRVASIRLATLKDGVYTNNNTNIGFYCVRCKKFLPLEGYQEIIDIDLATMEGTAEMIFKDLQILASKPNKKGPFFLLDLESFKEVKKKWGGG